jgi:hypothetical protein
MWGVYFLLKNRSLICAIYLNSILSKFPNNVLSIVFDDVIFTKNVGVQFGETKINSI